MTTNKKRRPILRPRTTVPLGNTTRSTPLHLDHAADLALHYAQAWLRHVHPQKVPASGVVRRALQTYAAHLDGLPEERRPGEFQAARSASTGAPRTEDPECAWARLAAAFEAGAAPPTFAEVLRGPAAVLEARDRFQRAEELLGAIRRGRP